MSFSKVKHERRGRRNHGIIKNTVRRRIASDKEVFDVANDNLYSGGIKDDKSVHTTMRGANRAGCSCSTNDIEGMEGDSSVHNGVNRAGCGCGWSTWDSWEDGITKSSQILLNFKTKYLIYYFKFPMTF